MQSSVIGIPTRMGTATRQASSGRIPRPLSITSRQRVCVKAGSVGWESQADEPGRHMALPNNALWLLSYLQDKFYNVRGSTFVIQRTESEASAVKRRRDRGLQVTSNPNAAGRVESSTSMIHKVVRSYPEYITQLLEGATIDISEFLEPCSEDEEGPSSSGSMMQANTTCTGIVRVEVNEDTMQEEEEEVDVFYTNSTSPRRTKMVGFTCKCCGARNYNSVNPLSFLEGTLVAQCKKCERWHKLSDHLGLFHNLQGPLFPHSTVTEEDVPPSLRLLDPIYWDLDYEGPGLN